MKKRIEVKKLEKKEDGTMLGSIPDSLGRKYFFHPNGKVYKLFSNYEEALAHFRGGFHPRSELETEKGVIYISSAEENYSVTIKCTPSKEDEIEK